MSLWNVLRTPYHSERPKEFALKIQSMLLKYIIPFLFTFFLLVSFSHPEDIKESAKTLKLLGLDRMCDWWVDRLQSGKDSPKETEKEDLLWQLFNSSHDTR
jgi:hypothetical protein